jgi:hypothetical protein
MTTDFNSLESPQYRPQFVVLPAITTSCTSGLPVIIGAVLSSRNASVTSVTSSPSIVSAVLCSCSGVTGSVAVVGFLLGIKIQSSAFRLEVAQEIRDVLVGLEEDLGQKWAKRFISLVVKRRRKTLVANARGTTWWQSA